MIPPLELLPPPKSMQANSVVEAVVVEVVARVVVEVVTSKSPPLKGEKKMFRSRREDACIPLVIVCMSRQMGPLQWMSRSQNS